MFSLSENNHSESSFLLGQNYTQLYNSLKKNIGEELIVLFARPDILVQTTKWTSEMKDSIKTGAVRSLEDLNEWEKDEVSDYFENTKGTIENILRAKPEFRDIVEILFRVPADKDIKVVPTVDGLRPVMTQWGCKSNLVKSTIDPVSLMLNRPRNDSGKVTLVVRYTDGSPAENKPYFQAYLGKETPQKTNSAGTRDMGRIKHGVTFQVYDIVEGKKMYLHEFTVEKDGQYIMTIPLFVQGSVRVVNQKKEPLPQFALHTSHNGITTLEKTNEVGLINLVQLEVGKDLNVSALDNPTNTASYSISRENNDFVFTVYQDLYSSATIEVRNENDELEPHYTVSVDYNGVTQTYTTSEQGTINLPALLVGKELKATDSKRIDNFVAKVILEEENVLVLRISKPAPVFVQVKLVNHKNKPLPNIPIDFAYNTQQTSLTTNSPDAVCVLGYETFIDNEKVKAKIRLPAKNKTGERIVNKKFTFKADKREYILKLRRYNYWWLLLLLLPLLLIRCEKTVFVKVMNAETGRVIPNIQVKFDHRKQYIYDKGSFFTNTAVARIQNTNNRGIAKFDTLKYSVYGYIFYHLTEAKVRASTKCYETETLLPYFHWLWNNDTIRLKLRPIVTPLDFKVIDKDDKEPLPDADVEIIAELDGKIYKDKQKSSADGRVIYKSVPKCATIKSVKATLEGYLGDSILNKEVQNLMWGTLDSLRTLRLKPIKKPIEFYVVECKTNKPIPDATVTIDIIGKKAVRRKTNVNGVGKGTYDSLHIKSKISLIAEKPYYKRGKLEGDYTVEEFIKLPKEKRTICLEPEPNPIEFKNIDEKTKRPISGVKNIIKRKRGNEVKTDTLISNRDGNFVIGDVVAGEDISIVAQYPPDYEDNDRTIKNKTGEEVIKLNPNERIIPLKPKEVELVFRTIDEDDGSLIPSANLQIYFDGQIQNDQPQKSPNNSGNGEFVIKVPVTAKISIIASKQGYGTNTTKINNALVKTLIGKPQPDRDIPLKTPKLGCNQPIEASKGFSGEMYFQLGKKSYDFKIDYKMHGHPDKITIYCGRGKGGKILWEDTITDMEGSPKTISYDATQCDGITIEIIPTQNNQGSSWEFSITCPE